MGAAFSKEEDNEQNKELQFKVDTLKKGIRKLQKIEEERLQKDREEAMKTKWRDDRLNWDTIGVERSRQEVKDICDKIKLKPIANVKRLRLLLCGLMGSGKSSLINGFCAAVSGGKYVYVANAAQTVDGVTLCFKPYQFEIETGQPWSFPFDLCDFRGLGDGGATEQSVKAALYGHLEEGQLINETPDEHGANQMALIPSSETSSNRAAKMLLLVQEASTVNQLREERPEYLEMMKKAMAAADGADIPTAVFLTKCDNIETFEGAKFEKLHYSKKVEQAVRDASDVFGRNVNRIFPVKNFTEEFYADPQIATQFLFPLTILLEDLYKRLP